MDKLELDARIAQLERRVAYLLVLVPLMIAGGVLVMITMVRTDDQTSATRTFDILPAPTVPMPTPTPFEIAEAVPALEEGSVPHLAAQLRDLAGLRDRSIITSTEFQAKKQQFLTQPLKVHDLKTDLEALSELMRRGVLTSTEYDVLKQKVLGLKN